MFENPGVFFEVCRGGTVEEYEYIAFEGVDTRDVTG